MNKFMSIIVLASVMFLAVGCCDDAKAATPAKLSVNAVAQAGFDNLTADQQAQVLQSITAIQTKDSAVIDNVDKWVNVGERIGKMLGGAAREVGMAANDFAKTDVGRMTALLIMWNYMGQDVISIAAHFGGALMVLILGFTWLFTAVRRSTPITRTYDPTQKNWFGNAKLVKEVREKLSGDQQVGYTVSAAVVIGVATILVVTF